MTRCPTSVVRDRLRKTVGGFSPTPGPGCLYSFFRYPCFPYLTSDREGRRKHKLKRPRPQSRPRPPSVTPTSSIPTSHLLLDVPEPSGVCRKSRKPLGQVRSDRTDPGRPYQPIPVPRVPVVKCFRVPAAVGVPTLDTRIG